MLLLKLAHLVNPKLSTLVLPKGRFDGLYPVVPRRNLQLLASLPLDGNLGNDVGLLDRGFVKVDNASIHLLGVMSGPDALFEPEGSVDGVMLFLHAREREVT